MGDHYEEIARCMEQESREQDARQASNDDSSDEPYSSDGGDGQSYAGSNYSDQSVSVSGMKTKLLPYRHWWERGIFYWTLNPLVHASRMILCLCGLLLIFCARCIGGIWSLLWEVFPPLPFIFCLILIAVLFGK